MILRQGNSVFSRKRSFAFPLAEPNEQKKREGLPSPLVSPYFFPRFPLSR